MGVAADFPRPGKVNGSDDPTTNWWVVGGRMAISVNSNPIGCV